jgi:acylaminoacyl-peptidase
MRVRSFPLAAALLLATTLPMTGQADRLALRDVFDMEFASDPQISPDGARIVYVRQFADIMTDRRHSNLWIVRADGSDHRPLTSGDQSDHTPRWSPDGGRLAFISDRDGSPQVYMRWMDTEQTAAITNLTEPPSGLVWSPDGSHLAFRKIVPSASPKIEGMPTPPSGATWAEPAQVIDRLVYRFDQLGDLPHGFMHLFVIPAEGGTPRQITSGAYHHGGFGFGAANISWSPDSKSLVVSANRRPDFELRWTDSEIFEFSVLDGSMRQLTTREGPDDAPVVSPNGRQIAYTGYDERFQGYQLTRLHVMNRDGSGSRVVSDELDRSVSNPKWAPDGSGLFVTFDDEGTTKLAFFRLDGSYEVVAEELGGRGSAYGGRGSFTVANNGSVAMNHTTPTVPADIAVKHAGRDRQVLTAVNADLFAGRSLGEVEEIWYNSSHDGRRIQGWIIKPPGFNPGRKYPLVIEIHGGPFANYGDRFDLEKQMMAAQGYVVLYVNPRGSTSYGEEFGNLIHHAYPGDDFFDLNSGVDAVIERGYIDENRLYVTGGSGGGILTAWMVGRTDRFRAAVAYYPVINWYSFALTADMAPVAVSNWFPGLPWDHVEHYESRSLLSVVENVKTPTMIMTGEEDYRTPMSESEQYFKALKLLGVETRLIRVPGEPHGIRRRPSHHIAKMLALLNWFQQHAGVTS